ncbi:1-acyl-sn-glycerol-3-phosphate acyltransferase [Myxococcota bacterium]|nr:1-acyl-sn-glycerol-3-phosphate acyltransferase [Myxococcota bacterium]
MALHRNPATPPSPENLAKIQRAMRWLIPMFRLGLRPRVPISVSGLERFPKEGPVFLLSNHQTALDPILLTIAVNRPVHFMATQALLQEGPVGRFVGWIGAVPKKKFSADLRAVKQLIAWRDLGAAVGLFPEGQRSWDGEPLPLLDGIEKLIRLMKAPVVTARLHNADRVWPRWAPAPRWGQVHVELDPPEELHERDPKELRALLEQRVQLWAKDSRRYPVRGGGLAAGLNNALFACPRCGAMDSLDERGDALSCHACLARYTVTPSLTLLGADGERPIAEAVAAAKALVTLRRVADPARFSAEGVVMESERAELFDVTEDDAVPIGAGHLRLTAAGLSLHPTRKAPASWRLPFSELRATSVELRRRLQFQGKERIFEVVLPTESAVKWEWMVPRWQRGEG